ncbi:hypothetical protein [Acinetobacter baumannii]|uniref:hypothetical protein n=1 Tax=Acinetobacter baumannii TaxID=470 RepID=UPI001D0DB90A|nr:hypothetical protein [Acinetobacter baumannii]
MRDSARSYFCIFHHDKDYLRHLRIDIERFLAETLKLKTNAKTQIFPVSIKNGRSLDFLGYQMWPTHRRVRKSSVSRIHRKIRFMQKQYSKGRIPAKRIYASMQSWLAHASHAQSYGLRKSILKKAVFYRKVDRNTTNYVLLPKPEDSNRC